jgi:hypothetical protein
MTIGDSAAYTTRALHNGMLEPPMLWSRALSAAEVGQLYVEGAEGYPNLLRRCNNISYFLPYTSAPVDVGTNVSSVSYNLGNPVTDHPLNQGLVSWWLPLSNNNGGSKLFDIKGGRHGTFTNGPTWTAGPPPAPAVSFTSSAYVDLGSFAIPQSAGTFSLFFRPTWAQTDGVGHILLVCQSGGTWFSFEKFSDNNFYAGWTNQVSTGTFTLNQNRWNHLAFVWDSAAGTKGILYINGTSVATSGSISTWDTTGTVLALGCRTSGANTSAGDFSLASLHSRAFSSSEVLAHADQCFRNFPDLLRRVGRSTYFLPHSFANDVYPAKTVIDLNNPVADHPLNKGMVGWWLPLANNSGGSKLFDLVGGYHGVFGATTTSPTWVAGPNAAQALSFDGSDDRWVSSLSSLSAVTVETVYRSTSSASNMHLANHDSTAGGGGRVWQHRQTSAGKFEWLPFDFGGNPRSVVTNATVNDDKWQHIVCVYSSSVNAVYVNGALDATGTTDGGAGLASAVTNLEFGLPNGFTGGAYFSGQLAHVAILNRVITASEVWGRYEQWKRGFPDLLRRTPAEFYSTDYSEPSSATAYSLPIDAGTYNVTGTAVGLAKGNKVAVASGSYTLTGQAVTLKHGYTTAINSGSYTITGQAVALRKASKVSIASGSYAITGQNVTLRKGYSIAVGSGSYTISGQDISLRKASRVVVAPGSYSVTGQNVTLRKGSKLAVDSGTYVISGQAITLRKGVSLIIGSGSYTITGQNIDFKRTYAVGMNSGSYTITGQNIVLRHAHKLVLDPGSYTLSGQAITLRRGISIPVASGSYSITGQNVNFRRAYVLAENSGSYSITGQAINLKHGFKVPMNVGSYTLSGQNVTLRHGFKTTIGSGSYAITGQNIGLKHGYSITENSGSYSITGQNIGLKHGYKIPTNSGSYSITGQNVTLRRGYTIAENSGSYAITGQNMNFKRTYALAVNSGTYLLTGQDVALSKSGSLTILVQSGSYSISGQPITLRKNSRVAVAPGSYLLTGQNVTLRYGRASLAMNPGFYVYAGQSVGFVLARMIHMIPGAYSITGQNVALSYLRGISMNQGAYVLSGRDINLFTSFEGAAEEGEFAMFDEMFH